MALTQTTTEVSQHLKFSKILQLSHNTHFFNIVRFFLLKKGSNSQKYNGHLKLNFNIKMPRKERIEKRIIMKLTLLKINYL